MSTASTARSRIWTRCEQGPGLDGSAGSGFCEIEMTDYRCCEDVIGLGDAVTFTFYGQSGLAATVIAPKPTVRTPPPPPPPADQLATPPPPAYAEPPPPPTYATPPPDVPYDSGPEGEFYGPPPKKRRTGLWIGCGCGSIIGLILLAIIIFFVQIYKWEFSLSV